MCVLNASFYFRSYLELGELRWIRSGSQPSSLIGRRKLLVSVSTCNPQLSDTHTFREFYVRNRSGNKVSRDSDYKWQFFQPDIFSLLDSSFSVAISPPNFPVPGTVALEENPSQCPRGSNAIRVSRLRSISILLVNSFSNATRERNLQVLSFWILHFFLADLLYFRFLRSRCIANKKS